MKEFGYVKCPECGRRYSAHVKNNSKIEEVVCRDCTMMPGWHKDFDSPPSPDQWQHFKATNEKIAGNPPRG